MKDLLNKGIQLAHKAHKGQLDKAGDDYIKHPTRVMVKLDTEEEKIVGILHDVLEDSVYTAEDLVREGFTECIVGALIALTRTDTETYMEYISRVSGNELATKVKLADLEDNMDLSRLPQVTKRDLSLYSRYKKAHSFLINNTKGV